MKRDAGSEGDGNKVSRAPSYRPELESVITDGDTSSKFPAFSLFLLSKMGVWIWQMPPSVLRSQ